MAAFGSFRTSALTLLCSIVLPLAVQAQVTWDGDTDDNWQNGNNWVGGSSPVATSDVNITLAAPNFPTFNSPAQINTLTLGGGFAGLVTLGNPMTVTGAFSAGAGTTVNMGASSIMGSIAGAGTLNINVGTLMVGGANTSTSFTGTVAGAGALTKTGTGTLTLAGTNSYTGTTTISGGTLQIGAGGALNFSSSDVVNNGALVFNGNGLLYGGVISGTGTVTKDGVGIMAISGANTYTGATTINAGTLAGVINNNAALTVAAGASFDTGGSTVGSLAGAGTVNANSGIFTVGGANTSTSFTGTVAGAGALTKTGTGTLTLAGTNSYTGTTTISGGTLQIGAGGALNFSSSDVVNNGALVFNGNGLLYGGVISGTGTVTKDGVGIMAISGANTYTGATTINAGTLAGVINNNAALTVAAGASFDTGGSTVGSLAGAGTVNANSGIFTVGGANTSTSFTGTVAGAGALTKTGTGTLTLAGTNSYTGTTTISGGTLQIGAGGALNFSSSDVVNNGALVFNGNGLLYGGVISGTGTVTKDGVGIMAISGANTYTGGTVINGGAVSVGADNNLGNAAGTLMFGGGTLLYTSGFLSARTITLNAGGGTIDTNGNTSTLSGAISGVGALTKAGAGILTLSGANTYTGATTVSAGTLQAVAANVFGTNSAVTVSGGATLDLNSNNQAIGSLAGSGAVTLGAATLMAGGNNGTTTFSGIMSGTGALTKAGAGTLTLSGANTYTGATTINAGTLAVNGTITSATTINSGGTLGGTGTIFGNVTANAGGTIAPGNSIGTIIVNGNVTFNPGSTFRVEIDPGAADRINVVGAPGTATLNGGTVDVQAVAGIYPQNTLYTIVNATGGVTGTFAAATSNFAFLSPTLSYNANNAFLSLAQTNSFISAAVTPNQRAVAGALDAVQPMATGDFATALNAVSSLLTGQAGAAFDSMSGQVYGTIPMIGLTNSTLFARTLSGRIGQMQTGEGRASTGLAFSNLMLAAADTGTVSDALPAAGVLPASAKLEDGRGVWIRGYGVSGNLSGDGNAAGADYNMAGTAAGVDRLINNRLLLGISAGYIRTSASLNGLSDSATVQSYQAGAYGSYAEGPWTLKTILRYAYNDYETTRGIVVGSLNRTATGDYGGHEGSLYTESAYSFTKGSTTLQPLASLQYVYLRQNSFTEQGAGSLNLNVNPITTQSLRSLLGPRLSHVVELKRDQTTITVEGRALWSHEWGDTNSSITTRFAGAPAGGDFTVAGVTVGRDGAVLGAGAMATFSSVFSAFTDYNAEVRNRQTEHQFVGGFRWTW